MKEKLANFIVACKEEFIASLLQAEAAVFDKIASSDKNEDDEDKKESSHIMQVVDGVAIIEIKGKLTSSDSWINKYFGLLSYNEIRKAFSEAYEDSEVNYILEDYDTPGGHVGQMKETADFMESVGKHKPRTAFVGSMAASAGYYLAKNADNIVTTEMSEIGSIGVVQMTLEYSEMLKKEGIKPTIIRSGDLKMVGNPLEKLSSKSKKYFQEQVDYMADQFFNSVQTARGISPEVMEHNDITSGRTYIGEQAVQVGLADEINTFDDTLSMLQEKSAKADSHNEPNNSLTLYAKGGNMKKILSKEALATLAAGISSQATEEEVKVAEKAAADEAAKIAAEEATKVAEEEEAAKAAEAEENDKDEELEDANFQAADETDESELEVDPVVAQLEAQVQESSDKLAAAEKNIEELKAEMEKLADAGSAIRAIATCALNNMQVALGRQSEDFSDVSDEDFVSRHDAIKSDFESAFVVGGVTTATSESSDEKNKVVSNSIDAARINSVGL